MKTNETKFTPAPWSVADINDDPNCIVICANDKMANDEWEIATPHGPDAKANAALIAAAPELFAALADLVAAEDASCDQFTAKEIDRIEAAMHRARKIMARAAPSNDRGEPTRNLPVPPVRTDDCARRL